MVLLVLILKLISIYIILYMDTHPHLYTYMHISNTHTHTHIVLHICNTHTHTDVADTVMLMICKIDNNKIIRIYKYTMQVLNFHITNTNLI